MMGEMEAETSSAKTSVPILKASAAEAFGRRDYHAAYDAYTQLLGLGNGSHAEALINRSVVAYKLGEHGIALDDADAAIAALGGAFGVDDTLLVKAHYRRIAAIVGLGHDKDIANAVRRGMAAFSLPEPAQRLRAALAMETSPLTANWLAEHWAYLIEAAEEPLPLSTRDGHKLRLVPANQRLSQDVLRAQLQAAIGVHQLAVDARCMLTAPWQRGKAPGRAALALMRGYAYLQDGQHDIAVRDALFALTYGPHQSGKPSWARAHALHAAVLEAATDNTPAALAFQKAVELRPGVPLWQAALERLLQRIPDSHAAALKAGGSAKLEALLAHDAEEATPEFLRQRPKYYYYNQWMRERIAEHCGRELPEPVVLKMLDMEAGELDLILNYPTAAQQQVLELQDVYTQQGPERFKAMKPPQLTWDQVRALKPGAVGLGMGGVAPGEILPSENQILGIEAAPTVKPLLLTDGGDDGEASSHDRAATAGVMRKAGNSAARQAQLKDTAAAAAAAASMSEDRGTAESALVNEDLTVAPSVAGREIKSSC